MGVHVSWNRVRDDAYFFVIADLTADGWEFWERESWEIRWYRLPPTEELIAKAESFLHDRELATALTLLRVQHADEYLAAGTQTVYSSRPLKNTAEILPTLFSEFKKICRADG